MQGKGIDTKPLGSLLEKRPKKGIKSRDTETGLEALLDYIGKLGSIKNQQETRQTF